MKKYHIFISDNDKAESVTDFFVESDKPVEEVVKAVALQEIYERYLDEEEIETINFDGITRGYGVLVECKEMHLAVWCEELPLTKFVTIDERFYHLASNIKKCCYYDSYENPAELKDLIDKIYNKEEK